MTLPLVVKDLKKTYHAPGRGPVEAVRGISFEIKPGECFGLLGPNGAGKSTSMNCISGFYPATSGSVLVHGIEVYQAPRKARQLLGVCSQEDTLDSDFTAFDQMVRYATYFRIPVAEAKVRAADLMRRFGLENKQDQMIEELSGGMRRRLQVARALISRPQVLILDEPTTGLDPEARRILWDIIIQERKNGVAVLLSTHYMEEAERLCDRIAILHSGTILDCASPPSLIAKHVAAQEISEEVRPGVVWKRPPNLEDVYMKLAGSKLEKGSYE